MGGTRRSFLRSAAGATIGAVAGGGLAVWSIGARTRPDHGTARLLLNWKPSGLHVPYYVARAKGFYDEEGLTLEAIESGQGSDFSATQVGLGNVPFAITSADQVLNVNSRELSPRSVGVVMQRSPVVVFSTRETFGEPLKSPEQLAGKTVGSGPGMVRLLTRLLLERAGVAEQVELVETGYDTVQQLLAGKIDAAGGVFGDAVSTRHQGATVDAIRVADTVPSYGHVVAASPSILEDRPEAVRAFLRATAHGAAWATRHPGHAIDLLVEEQDALATARGVQRDKWEVMADEYVLSPAVEAHGWGWSEADPWGTMADALADADLLGGTVDPESVWTNDYLDTDSQFVGSYAEQIAEG